MFSVRSVFEKKNIRGEKNTRVHPREMLKIRSIFTNMLTGRGSKSTKGVRARKNASIERATLSRCKCVCYIENSESVQ